MHIWGRQWRKYISCNGLTLLIAVSAKRIFSLNGLVTS